MGCIGWSELIVISGLVLLLFGAKRIPELARALGQAKREFQKAQQDLLADAVPQAEHRNDQAPAKLPANPDNAQATDNSTREQNS